ncbi:bifunctional 4-hydroxy-2-oxoglutarate aldolase/2-dehydro-3-deoxy-phosphogluconate aldolase [Ammoniphilus resinae]|uniref:2-dehydro-3-deoxyphosphogluconate aldolase/(4S)-4-hydroxy-2-oxoglutarate aldolase n=1 Tax=Ammoniphilus resinae TaxID=861532 RepID=A0ABS4GQY0_9BACL|nr:bifunctional 4-hydroxy-2-oxoglutarate aldolase/2-dehydro-3-deoxy-phosphogluconate aldolase [Ammoniphilus resinae]MBP1932678.1 2-dehydro-3-deoxyphosphogluconate aldolase/(4S)-4-hydroxy-2-oxoglutarate aldolase [Ammoniphilus resinae]
MSLPKVSLLQKLVESGVIAVIRRLPEDKVEKVAEALVDGGVTALEVTVDSQGAFQVIEKISKQLKGRAIVGAGTVIDSESARLAIVHGADFVFSPSLHQDVIKTALRYGKIAVPGVMTPTEMITALEWGADLVKIFPAAGLGVRYIKDVKAPFPQVPVIPTGGVDLNNVADFIKAGVAAVGIGGNLMDKAAIEQNDFAKITQIAAQYVAAIQSARLELKK